MVGKRANPFTVFSDTDTRSYSLNKKKVLVVGASGRVGGVFLKTFADRYGLPALNRKPIESIPCYRADISDLDAILPAFKGIDTVLSLVNEGGLND